MSGALALPAAVVLVKLGGSLLTDKRQARALRAGELARIAGEVARAATVLRARGEGLVVGHGSGSFGHVAAARLGYDGSATRRREGGAGAIQHEAAALHQAVAGALLEQGLEMFSLLPGSFLVADGGAVEAMFEAPLLSALRARWVVLTQGDVVMDRALGFTICSTEQLLLEAVRVFGENGVLVREVLFFGETDGLRDRQGATIPTVSLDQRMALGSLVERPAGTDVTGGMELRLETVFALARAGVRSRLLDGRSAGAIERALCGLPAGGTTVLPERGAAVGEGARR